MGFIKIKNMPLIIMCGIPCSGKTTRSKELETYLRNVKKMDVQVVNEELLNLSKAAYLYDPNQEKILRASLGSNVEKYITDDRVVILDSMNYIKGYRYEMWCLCRSAKTTLAVVYCEIDEEVARKRCKIAN